MRFRGRGRAVALCLAAVAMLLGASPSPAPSPAAAAEGDRAPLSADVRISEADLQHDSRDDRYRTPGGAVPTDTPVALRLRAGAGDLTSAEVRVTDVLTGDSGSIPMTLAATDPSSGEHGYDYWEATTPAPDGPTVRDYWFVARDGAATRYLSDDPTRDGGTGRIDRQPPSDGGWSISTYDAGFATPAWTRGAVVYQIFPDRFRNGDPANDPSPDEAPAPTGPGRFRYPDIYGNEIVAKAWDERPEGYCRAYQGVACDEQPLGRDFYGGDLAGITESLDGLADLGVTVLYLNPIFAAPSNHRYDTSDYFTIDPDLGDLDDFEALIEAAHERGIRVMLDGVFNHVSSDSPWFDRSVRFAETGACESADSEFRDWFTFRAPGLNEPGPCAPSTTGGDDTYYTGWFGFDTIPELQEIPPVLDLVTGQDGVVRTWLERGIDGWRLDVADSLSPDLLRRIREAVKDTNPEALIVAEQWGRSAPWLLGDQADSTMDYRFRRAVIGLVNGETADPDGAIPGLTPSGFARAMLAVQEDYPPAAWDALMHLVDSHDTARILWTLTPGDDNDSAKQDPDALAAGKGKLGILAAIELTFPGMAAIYYGDEVGLSGHDDPDDRRPYPWGAEDLELRGLYQRLARLRAEHVALREGGLEFRWIEDATGTLAYLRRAPDEAAVTAVNLGDRERTIEIDVAGRLPDGTVLTEALGEGASATVEEGQVSLALPSRSATVWITAPGTDLVPPEAPESLEAIAGAGIAEIEWSPSDGAAEYQVWRSLVSGGGYELVARIEGAAFSDQDVRDGMRHHYVITALDETGNESARSPEAVAMPQLWIEELRVLSVEPSPSTLSATDAGPTVTAMANAGGGDGVPDRFALRVEIGLGPTGTDPSDAERWTWAPAEASAAPEGVLYRAELRPEAAGTFAVAARASTDGGLTWTFGDSDGIADGYTPEAAASIEMVQGPDREPPSAPVSLEVLETTGDHITLRWDAVGAPDLYRYQVLRAPSATGAFEPVGTTPDPVFADTSVEAGVGYAYAVIAQDTSYNVSTPSEPIEVDAARRDVAVTFRVSVPDYTPATDTVRLAGDFQQWDPGATPMTRVDDTTWEITVPFEDGTVVEYKYTRGSWEAVEKDAGCGEIPNRRLEVTFDAEGRQLVEDTVDKWRDLDQCG